MKRSYKPVLTLLAITPFLTELLSGNIPPPIFFSPVVYVAFIFLYGIPALVVREIAVRRQLGWGGIFILGLAYGIVNEGIAAKTLLLAENVPMPSFDSYGYTLGLNFTWAPVIMIWHALHAILFPIVLVYLLFPAQREEAWLGKKVTTLLALLSLILVVMLFLGNGALRPSPLYLLVFLAAILVMGGGALRQPDLQSLARINDAIWRPLLIGFGLVIVSLGVLLVQAPQTVDLIRLYILLALPPAGVMLLGYLRLSISKKSVATAGNRDSIWQPVLLGFSFTIFWIGSLVLSAAKINLLIFYLYLALALLFFVHLLKKHNWLVLPEIALVGLGVYMSSGLFAIMAYVIKRDPLGVLVEVLFEVVFLYAIVKIKGRKET